ncbi:MAG: ABC transporter substrate-binding protein, partial [Woeseiaceae bacterium]
VVSRILLICFISLASFGVGLAADTGEPPVRVVSLDYCADQYVLKMLPRDRILAVSPDAAAGFSYMRESAAGVRSIRPLAEDVLAIRPDLVVRSYGGGPRATTFFERAGIPVLQIPYAGNFAEIRQATLTIAGRLHVPDQGRAIVREMNDRLGAIRRPNTKRNVLYMTSGGATSGPGTLVHEVLQAAGLDNYEQRPGWHSIPLERLAYEQPDAVAAAYFDDNVDQAALWSSMRHPLAQRQLQELPTVLLEGAWTSCGAWFLIDAVEALAASRDDSR